MKHVSVHLRMIIVFLIVLHLIETQHNAFATRVPGIMIPLYTYPGSTWDQVIAAKNVHPSVPIVAIINPSNGSGQNLDPTYTAGVKNLQEAGIMVLGYVHTNYATRDPSLAINDTINYKNWYGVNGTFFDEMTSNPGNETYYKNLSNYTHSIGLTFTVGNPGIDVSPSYVGTVDNIVIHDNNGLPNLSFLGGWHTGYDKSNFSILAYNITTMDPSFVKYATNYLGYIYLTNGTVPNPWNTIPPFFENLVSMMKNDTSVSVNSIKLANSTMLGIWTEVYSKNLLVKTGFTPHQYWLAPELDYVVCASDYQDYFFAYWDDLISSRCKTVGATQNSNFTAYYRTHSTLNVEATKTYYPLTGMWTEIYANNIQIESGFTPRSYSLLTFLPHVVCVADFQNNTFSHWENNNTSRCRTLELDNSNQTINAYYE